MKTIFGFFSAALAGATAQSIAAAANSNQTIVLNLRFMILYPSSESPNALLNPTFVLSELPTSPLRQLLTACPCGACECVTFPLYSADHNGQQGTSMHREALQPRRHSRFPHGQRKIVHVRLSRFSRSLFSRRSVVISCYMVARLKSGGLCRGSPCLDGLYFVIVLRAALSARRGLRASAKQTQVLGLSWHAVVTFAFCHPLSTRRSSVSQVMGYICGAKDSFIRNNCFRMRATSETIAREQAQTEACEGSGNNAAISRLRRSQKDRASSLAPAFGAANWDRFEASP